MPKVQLLPQNLINQIAAGEVIERPASVIKELVENSLDAGATKIEVLIKAAGRELISITDNGCGMEPADAKMALERHATSKIKTFDDLAQASTMGFRGEALPSIASIAYLTLKTRAASQDTCHEIRIEGGKVVTEEPSAGPVGTTVIVEHLFFNVPARRKFLKADNTELNHCVNVIKSLALANPEVGFKLAEGRRTIIDTPSGQTLRERIKALFGAPSIENLIEVESIDGTIELGGLISPPGQHETTRGKLFFFINRRPVDSRLFHAALREAYGATLGPGQYPSAFLFLKIPPAEIDVNVHPAKREVRFRAEGVRQLFVTKALGEALLNSVRPAAPLPLGLVEGPNNLPRFAEPAPKFPTPHFSPAFSAHPFSAPTLSPVTPQTIRASLPSARQTTFAVAQSEPSRHGWQFLSFFQKNFALFSTADGLALVDLANAQERIAYEKVESALKSGPVASQALLIPALIQLDGSLAEALEAYQQFIANQGFVVAPFGTGSYRLEAVPAWLSEENGFSGTPERLLLEELGLLAEGNFTTDTQLAHRAIAQMAAKYAQRTITRAEAACHVIEQLLACQNPLKTPFGAATVWQIAVSEIERRFSK